jgi:NADPH-dependent 2,4-dienoyl-CoA reductase/sulfur reductase-like enzyme
MTRSVDLLVIGAGPAGMAAAVRARAAGLDVLVVDDQPAPGGQIWRAVETVAAAPRGKILGDEYRSGAALARAFRASGAGYEPGTQVWQIESGLRVFMTRNRQASIVDARAILLATGAQERPVPFQGWTLPGVMTVGAAQIMLKTSGQIPSDPVWVAGSGPLPLLYMVQLLQAGGRIAGFLDTTPPGRHRAALPYLPKALLAAKDLLKGVGWMRALRRAGVPTIRHVADIEALGSDRIETLRYRTCEGQEKTVSASVLLVHEGVVPSIHATLATGCAHKWRDDQACYVPTLDEWGESSQLGIFVAGDAAGIGGARAARLRGDLAAIRIAEKLGRLQAGEASRLARPVRRQFNRELAARPFLDALFKPRQEIFAPSDATVVCRCEEVTAGEIRAVAAVGRPGPNQVKAFTRAGMGPCQGRQCGYTVAHILAAAEGRPIEDVGFYRIRPPLKPVTLGELASLDATENAA